MVRTIFLSILVVVLLMETVPISFSTSTTTHTSPNGFRLVRFRVLDSNSRWVAPPGTTAQQVLAKVSDLLPNVLERYISGYQSWNSKVPVLPGYPSMTVAQFLNASMQVCASENCYIIPRLSLDEYDKGTLFSTSKNLLSGPISPKLTFLSLDDWSNFSRTHNSSIIKDVFQRLYSEGWKGIGVNDCGGYSTSYGYATWADFCINTRTWLPNLNQLSKIRSEPNIKVFFLYIDFQKQMLNFVKLTPNQEASVFKNIVSLQSTYGYHYVYPVFQGDPTSATYFWNSDKIFLSNGTSMYTVLENLMTRYN